MRAGPPRGESDPLIFVMTAAAHGCSREVPVFVTILTVGGCMTLIEALSGYGMDKGVGGPVLVAFVAVGIKSNIGRAAVASAATG